MTPGFNDLYYFTMRLLRKYLFPLAVPARVRRFIPLIRPNKGTTSGAKVVNLYDRYLTGIDPAWLNSKVILEVGIGESNSSCYEMAARGALKCYALEPYVKFNEGVDAPLLAACAKQHDIDPVALASRVLRVMDIAALDAQSVDLVVSNSVLEHVMDNAQLATALHRVLKPNGRMLHIVDYRDHFFTYPYHHLLWSQKVWRRFLDPGDLPRWRIGDHVTAFEGAGFSVQILKADPISAEFEKIRARVHPELAHYSERDLQTAFGVLLAGPAGI